MKASVIRRCVWEAVFGDKSLLAEVQRVISEVNLYLAELPSGDEDGGGSIADIERVVSEHNTGTDAHADLRLELKAMADRINDILDSDDETLNDAHKSIAELTNHSLAHGTLADAMRGADVFIGVSAPGIVSEEMVASMATDAIVFPMANPTPEIMPDLAKKAGARIVGTGRSDFPNQINNVLAFPGIFRGALDCRASCINEEMKVATSHALASLISDEELNEENIIAPALDKRVAEVVAKAVIEAAHKTGVARI
jgi:malate dehydrogenase (oxaloacetate-decarboxylating)